MVTRRIGPRRVAIATLLGLLLPLGAQQRSNPPSMKSFQIPSHGAFVNAFVYVDEGPGPHPAVVLLHGFPGNERNLGLAQEIRRAGWDVLYFDYRGSWGSPGDFSFTHAIEDTAAAIDYLRSAQMAQILRLDPARIGLISAADMGGRIPRPVTKDREQAAISALSAAYDREGMAPLNGCTPEGLDRGG